MHESFDVCTLFVSDGTWNYFYFEDPFVNNVSTREKAVNDGMHTYECVLGWCMRTSFSQTRL